MKSINAKLVVFLVAGSSSLMTTSAQGQNLFVKFGEGCARMLIDPVGSLVRLGDKCYNPQAVQKTGGNTIVGDCNMTNSVVYGNVTVNCKSQVATVSGNNNKVVQKKGGSSGSKTAGKSKGGSANGSAGGNNSSGSTAQNDGSSYYEYEDQSGTKIKAKGKAAEYAAQNNSAGGNNSTDSKGGDGAVGSQGAGVITPKPGESTGGTMGGNLAGGTTKTAEPVYGGLDSNYVNTYNKKLNTETVDAKDKVEKKQKVYDDATTRSDRRTAKSELKDAKADLKKANGETEILKENRGGYGGQYGGAKVEVTDTVNMGVKTLSTIASQVATNSATNQNNNVMYGIQQQGSAATQKAINNSQADMMENSAKANSKLGMATVVMSAIQGERIYAHLNSRKKVNQTHEGGMRRAEEAKKEAYAEYQSDIGKTGKCAAMGAFSAQCMRDAETKWQKAQDLYAYQKDNANNNVNGELDAQNGTATKQTIEAATTAAQAAYMLAQANSLKKAANAIRNQPTADTGSGFSFNPGGVTAAPTPETSAVTTDPGSVVADDSVVPTDMGNTDLMNPNIADAGPGGPPAGAFQASNPASGSGGGGMGMGSVGGTSAAKDDAKPETSALTKSESGKYAAGEGTTGSRFSRSGGGAGVGIDSGIGDLLKKFLPGGEEDKKKDGDLAFDSDRSPASDQAAVLGRNQNIFEAIHKRYQKKHNEGAIVFVGDRG